MEVKFSNEKLIFEAVYYAIKNALNKQTLKKAAVEASAPKAEERIPAKPPVIAPAPKKETIPAVRIMEKPVDLRPQSQPKAEPVVEKNPIVEGDEPIVTLPKKNPFKLQFDQSLRETPVIIEDEPVLMKEEPVTEAPKQEAAEQQTIEPVKKEIPYQYIGELFRSFVVVESGEEVLVIDKHAAHERMIFERLLKECAAGESESQQMLVPERVQLSQEELAFTLENKEEFLKIGFEVDSFGERQIVLRSRPLCITNETATEAFTEILNDWMRGGKADRTERENRALKTVACKAAIKAGNLNDQEELKALVLKLIEDDEIHQCPHGRPIALAYSKKDIEKAFKRI